MTLVGAVAVLTVVGAGMTLADTFDVLTADQSKSFGNISAGSSANGSAQLGVSCSGNKHAAPGAMSFSTTITLSTGSAGDVSEVTVTPALSVPNTWPADGSNCGSPKPDDVLGTAAIAVNVPSGAAAGDRSMTVKIDPADGDVTNVANINVTYTVPGEGGGGGELPADADGDGVADGEDNCPGNANPDQADRDVDALGDECDANSYTPEVLGAGAPDANGSEGDTLMTGGGFVDLDGNSTLAITKVSGDGSVTDNGDGTWSWSLPTSDNGSGFVTVKATDLEHPDAIDSFEWSAANVAPSVNASFVSPVSCGVNNATLTVSFGDPGTADTHSAAIDWNGDAIVDETIDPAVSGFTSSHSYGAGNHNAVVSVTDDDGDSGSDNTSAVTVNYNTSGILQPVNWTQAQNNPSIFKHGSTVPVKVGFSDCGGAAASSLSVKVEVKKVSGSTPATGENESVTNTNSPDSGGYMRWDGTQYIYNLNTKSLSDSTATYQITLTVQSTGQTVMTNMGTKAK